MWKCAQIHGNPRSQIVAYFETNQPYLAHWEGLDSTVYKPVIRGQGPRVHTLQVRFYSHRTSILLQCLSFPHVRCTMIVQGSSCAVIDAHVPCANCKCVLSLLLWKCRKSWLPVAYESWTWLQTRTPKGRSELTGVRLKPDESEVALDLKNSLRRKLISSIVSSCVRIPGGSGFYMPMDEHNSVLLWASTIIESHSNDGERRGKSSVKKLTRVI